MHRSKQYRGSQAVFEFEQPAIGEDENIKYNPDTPQQEDQDALTQVFANPGSTVYGITGFGKTPLTVIGARITNLSRGGDRVLTAKDILKNIPGGPKELLIEVLPVNETIDLKLAAKPNQGGSAIFNHTGTDTWTGVSGLQSFTILGRDVSTSARSLAIEAYIRGTKHC